MLIYVPQFCEIRLVFHIYGTWTTTDKLFLYYISQLVRAL